jgi:hypothetical protein
MVLIRSIFLCLQATAVFCHQGCRVIPGDRGWPSEQAWDQLNKTVSGRLVATVPVASTCHDSSYDEAACLAKKEQWDLAQTQ